MIKNRCAKEKERKRYTAPKGAAARQRNIFEIFLIIDANAELMKKC